MKKPSPIKEIPAEVQRRLDALEHLIDSDYEGKVKLFSAKTGIAPPQVHQWFSGYRLLRENAVRRLEKAAAKPTGWFDSRGSGESLGVAATVQFPFPVHSLESSMERLAYFLAQVPQADRGQSSAALAALALQPEDHARKAAVLRLLIEPSQQNDQTAAGTSLALK